MNHPFDLTVKSFDLENRRFYASAQAASKNAQSLDLACSDLPLFVGMDRVGTVLDAYTSRGILSIEFDLASGTKSAQLGAMLALGTPVKMAAVFDGVRLAGVSVTTPMPATGEVIEVKTAQAVKADPAPAADLNRQVDVLEAENAVVQTKSFTLRIKRTEPTDQAAKVYSAVAWTAEPDRSGEQIDPAEFKFNLPMPLLKNHDHTRIAGTVIRAEVVADSLEVDFTLLDTAEGILAAKEIAGGALNAVSIGFIPASKELIELSLVPIGMHQDAKITQRSVQTQSLPDAPEPPAGATSDGSILEKSMQTLPAPAVHTRKQQPYSLAKLIRGLSDPTAVKDAGYEFEVSQETALRSNKSSSTVMVPWAALTTKATAAQDTITAPAAGVDLGASLATPANENTLFTTAASAGHLAPLAEKLKINVHTAAHGPFKIPRLIEPIKPAWVARDGDLPDDTAGFDSITATPHTLGVVTTINRSALIDSNPAMQPIITAAITAAVQDAMDTAIIGAKTQVANAPVGLAQLLAGATPALDLGLLADPLALLNAIRAMYSVSDSERLVMLADFGVKIWANTTALSAGLNMPMLLPFMEDYIADVPVVGSGKMAALAAGTTKTEAQFFVGPWTYCHLIMFGAGMELQVNPYAKEAYQRGAVLVRGIVDGDFVCRDKTRFRQGRVAI